MRHDRVSDIKLYQERRRQSGFYPNEIHHLFDDIDYLLSLLDGQAPTISDAVEKVKEMRDDYEERRAKEDHPAFAHYYTVARNISNEILSTLESLQPSGVVLVDREEAAKAICLFCAEPEHYGPPRVVEGSRRLWHPDLRNDCNGVVQCQAAAIRSLPPYGSKQNGDNCGEADKS